MCSSDLTVYLQKIEDTVDNRIIFRHKSGDDHVIYAEEVTTRDFTSSGIEDQEVFEKTLAELFKKEFGGMEGIDYSTEYNGKMVTLTVKFDYNKIDFEKFTQLESGLGAKKVKGRPCSSFACNCFCSSFHAFVSRKPQG